MKLLKFWLILVMVCGLSSCYETAPPPTGTPTIETSNSKSSSIGINGGKVTTTAANGVTYTLIIPPNALIETKTITLTPISSMGNAPLSAGVRAAVQMLPSGLSFKRAATLRIGMNSSLVAGKRLIGFSTANDGTKFTLKLPRVKLDFTELSINHFSDAGVGNATDAEIAGIPELVPTTDAPTSNDFIDQIDVAVTLKNTDQEIAAYFEKWFNEIVKPLLLDAENSSDLSKVIDAQLAFEKWFDARVTVAAASEGKINVEPFLTDKDAIARPIVTKLLVFELNQRIEDCKTNLDVASKLAQLYVVSLVQNLALKFGMNTASLDPANVALKINSCARVVLNPITLPDIVVGSDKSLDARAQIIFVGDPNPHDAPFEFSVVPTNATMKTPNGFSDTSGKFTTVFKPTTTEVSLEVKACLVLVLDVTSSDLCASQTAKPVVKDGIFRGTLNFTGSFIFVVNTNSATEQSSNSETTNTTLESSVEFNPKISSNLKFIQKNASKNSIGKRDATRIVTFANGACQEKVHQVDNLTEIGTSSIISTNDKAALNLIGTAYSLELLKLNGNFVHQGLDTASVSRVSGTCDLSPGSSTPFKFDLVDNTYLPNLGFFGKISGTGTVITNPDGSRTISGSKTVNTSSEISPGATISVNSTLTWNLTAF